MQYTFQIEKLSTGFMAFCPDMKPVIVFGKTEKEATEKLDVAVKLYVARHPEIKDIMRSAVLNDAVL